LEWREVEGEVIALSLPSSSYLSINQTGAVLWKLLADETTEDDLVAALVSAFDVDDASARRDVMAFLQELESQGLLVRQNA